MNHSFNTDIAAEYGIIESILLERFYFWIEKNIANEKHFYDGYYWTYSSVKALNEIYYYVSQSTLSRAIKHLENEGLLLKGNYNKSAYDRTAWYALTEKAYKLLNVNNAFVKMKNGLSDVTNQNDQSDEPIPVIETFIETINLNACEESQNENIVDEQEEVCKQTEENFDVGEAYEKILKIYPKTASKGAGFEVWKRMMLNTSRHLRKKLAYNVVEGILEYLDNYRKENPNDTSYAKIKEIEWWLKQDADYWIKWVEQKERNRINGV